jgi:hypothetical protein
MDFVTIIALLAGIALLIMSIIIRASAGKLTESNDEVNNIKRTSNILLYISIGVVLLYGWEVVKDFRSKSSSDAGFSYYF